jgi:hypothetical protein
VSSDSPDDNADLDQSFEFIVDSADIDELDLDELGEDLSEEDDSADELAAPDLEEEFGNGNVADLNTALAPGTPILLLHRSHQHAGVLPSVLKDISRRHADDLHLGVVVPMPRMSPDRIRQFFDDSKLASVRIADPEAFARLDSFGTTLMEQRGGKPYVGPSTQGHWRYLTEVQPAAGTQSWIETVLDEQRQVGATVLLTPGTWSNPAEPGPSLAIIRQHAAWAGAALGNGEHLAVNITLPASWLTTTRLRDQLLNEIVDMDETVFYMRVRWPLLSQPYGQLLSSEILDGYAELANVFEENDKCLLLPNSGLTGWIALAWGAHGFSTGIGAGERAFADTRVIRIRQTPRPAPTHRTFAETILHITDVTTATRLAALPDASPCRCRFCRIQASRPVGQWDKALAGAHYLRKIGDLTATLATNGRGRRVAARRLVRDANAFAENARNTVPLSDANDPRHLPLWAERLR